MRPPPSGYSPKARSCAYACSRNSLAALNSLYIFLGLILIGIAAYAKVMVMHHLSLPVLGGVIGCGVFLILIAMAGLVGAIRHSQVLLFFYMIIMCLLFIVQLSVSVAALAVTSDQQELILKKAWDGMNFKSRAELQQKGNCCGFKTTTGTNGTCISLSCCLNADGSKDLDGNGKCKCPTCYKQYKITLEHALSVAGGVGLFFSFTLLLGIYLAVKYRNSKDPAMNLDAFL